MRLISLLNSSNWSHLANALILSSDFPFETYSWSYFLKFATICRSYQGLNYFGFQTMEISDLSKLCKQWKLHISVSFASVIAFIKFFKLLHLILKLKIFIDAFVPSHTYNQASVFISKICCSHFWSTSLGVYSHAHYSKQILNLPPQRTKISWHDLLALCFV